MSANSFGSRFTVTSFGESHGPALGVVIDGCPAGVAFDESLLQLEMMRRRPGAQALDSSRSEADLPEILSGVFEGKTLGTPLAMIVRNQDARSQDYKPDLIRPGHADDTWMSKFGHRDYRGGGRASGRETVSRVMAGAVAQMVLRSRCPSLRAYAFTARLAHLKLKQQDYLEIKKRYQSLTPPLNNHYFDQFPARFPSPAQSIEVEKLLTKAKENGQSYGAIAEIWIENVPAGLGQPVFHKLKADLASAVMGIGATAAIEIGDGFSSALAEGSEFHARGEDPYGGMRGGISTGDRIVMKVAFKPTSSVGTVATTGRHDPTIVSRAIPVLEAMINIVLADHVLWARTDRI